MVELVVLISVLSAATFHLNPQYRITLEDPDDDDADDKCTVIIALMQVNLK